MGPSYNFTFAFEIVTALHSITNVGFMVAEQSGENNAYALRFTMGDIDHIKGNQRQVVVSKTLLGDADGFAAFLTLLSTNAEEETAWRKAAEADVPSRGLEELVAALVFKIKKANGASLCARMS